MDPRPTGFGSPRQRMYANEFPAASSGSSRIHAGRSVFGGERISHISRELVTAFGMTTRFSARNTSPEYEEGLAKKD